VRPLALTAAIVCAAATGLAMLVLVGPVRTEAEVSDRPIQVADDGYLSSAACKACHPSEYETWRASYHRTMTQVATPDSVRAGFDGISVTELPGNPIRLTRRGAEFWAELNDPDAAAPAGASPPRIERQIVMTTGSHQQQVYWYSTGRGRLLGQLPAMFLIGDQRWIPRAAAFMRPPADSDFSETGRWNGVCINCHATHGKWRFGGAGVPARLDQAGNADTTIAELGIACEACHGPAAEHVRSNRNPLRRYALHLTRMPDPSIVQPIRLDPALTSEVCGQCHSVWNYHDRDDEQRVNETGLPYRPGDELRQTRLVAQPASAMTTAAAAQALARDPGLIADSFWSDGMIRVSGREYNGLIESPCYRNGTGAQKLSCSSCHTMHRPPSESLSDSSSAPLSTAAWADRHQVGTGMDGNQACVQCHQSIGSGIAAHTRHQPESSGSACQNCHMPYTTYGLLRAMRSHQISSPTVAASIETGRPNACNLCHLDKTLQWTADALEGWYGTPPVPLTRDQQTIAASLLWLLGGDAGQRALAAWSMGWPPAQAASGTAWTAPYLSGLLDDPYAAVRYIANRSLKSLPGLGAFSYDFVAPSERRLADVAAVLSRWQAGRGRSAPTVDPALLYAPDGSFDAAAINRLVKGRNDRRVSLRE
jgi:hypothetical protein